MGKASLSIEQARRNLQLWREDPVLFVKEHFDVEPDDWQVDALRAFASRDQAKMRISLQACAGPGKSACLAWMGWNFLLCYGEHGEHPKGAVLSVTSDNLKDNLWAELSKWQARSPALLAAFEWTKERIFAKSHPSTWFISARSFAKTADAEEQGRTLSGLHSKYVLYLIDESGDIPPQVLKSAEQGLSTKPTFGKIVQAGNPTSHEGMLYAAAVALRHQWYVITITGDPEAPNRSKRIDITWARDQIQNFGRDNPWVKSYILGEFPEASINSLLGLAEVEMAMHRHYRQDQYDFSQKRIGCDVARFGGDRCFDDQTEILTSDGWKLFSELTGLERVLSLDGDTANWEAIDAIHKHAFNGELNLFEGRAANFCVTDNHQFLVRSSQKSNHYVLKKYTDLPGEYVMRAWNNWGGINEPQVKFETIKKMPHGGTVSYHHTFQALEWASFLGWFVSEGCVYTEKRKTGRYRIVLTQNPGAKRKQIEDLLSSMGIKWRTCAGHGKQIEFTSKSLGQYLLRECGHGASNKKVPREIKDGSTEVIEEFLNAFLLGDGTCRKSDGGGRTYRTSSKQLANDIQEMLSKVGRAGKMSIHAKAGTEFQIEGRNSRRLTDVYAVYERGNLGRGSQNENRDKFIIKKKASRVWYSGFVWCVSTKHQTIYVRRKGIPMWSGNSVMFPRQGLVSYRPVIMRGARTNEIAARLITAKTRFLSELEFVDDTGGWGAGVIDCMLQAGHNPVPINFSGKPINPRFFNRRTEMWWNMADWVKKGGALPYLPEMIRELTAPTYTFQNGKIRLEEKEQIKQRLQFSPDMADALCLTFALPDAPAQLIQVAGYGSVLNPLAQKSNKALTEWDPFDETRNR